MSQDSADAASTADAPTAEAPARGSRWRHRPFIEIVAVAMLSVTAILTAWCGFQASKWSGERSIAFAEVPDRNAAETWRGRYLLLPADELPPPRDDEVYVHELPGMRVELEDGELVGSVEETYELPQGLAIDVRRAPPRERETVLLQFDERTIASVDRESRVIVVTPPEGLLE